MIPRFPFFFVCACFFLLVFAIDIIDHDLDDAFIGIYWIFLMT